MYRSLVPFCGVLGAALFAGNGDGSIATAILGAVVGVTVGPPIAVVAAFGYATYGAYEFIN